MPDLYDKNGDMFIRVIRQLVRLAGMNNGKVTSLEPPFLPIHTD